MGDWTPKFRPGADVTYQVATAAVTGGQVVALAAAGQCAFTTAASANVLGVAATDGAIGDKIEVMRGGVQRCTAGATVAVLDPLKSAANGRVVPYVVGTDPVTQLIGFALTAGANGAVVDVQWKA